MRGSGFGGVRFGVRHPKERASVRYFISWHSGVIEVSLQCLGRVDRLANLYGNGGLPLKYTRRKWDLAAENFAALGRSVFQNTCTHPVKV